MKFSKSTEFSIKLVILICLLAFLVFDFYVQLYAPKSNLTGITYYQRININYAFFTTQSNYIVVFYLFYALFLKNSYSKRVPFGIELAVTVYITVTMLVFWFGLVASGDEMGSYNAVNWLCTVVLHLIIPVIMIIQFLFSAGDNYYCMRAHSKFALYGIALYPTLYLVYALVRGELRMQEYGPDFFSRIYYFDALEGIFKERWFQVTGGGAGVFSAPNMQPFTSQMWYPYWFLNFRTYELGAFGTDGEWHIWESSRFSPIFMSCLLACAIITITSMVIGLQFFYIYINNDKYYRWHDINGKLLTKSEHDYRMKLRKQNYKLKWQNIRSRILETKMEKKKFKESIRGLEKSEREVLIQERINVEILNKKLKKAEKINILNLERQKKRFIRTLLMDVKSEDRGFIKDNIREAERYKKLVRRGVIILSTNDNPNINITKE